MSNTNENRDYCKRTQRDYSLAFKLQVVDEVNIVAPEHASLDGGIGSVTQILKVKSELLVDEILM